MIMATTVAADKRKAYERGYREGWRDRDDHRGKSWVRHRH